ncbi:MAG: hypothetical protein AAGA18_06325 [Verrucomicrobiota bacterium]
MGLLIKIILILGILIWMSWRVLHFFSKKGGNVGRLADDFLKVGSELKSLFGKTLFWSLVIAGLLILAIRAKQWFDN